MKNIVVVFALVGILFTSTFALQATAAPNENANDKAHEKATFQIPENAVEIAPGIFSLGTIEVNGQILQGILAYHHRNGHDAGPPGGGEDPDPTDTSSCYSYISGSKPVPWKTVEDWVVNPANNDGLSDAQVLAALNSGLSAWETEVGPNILGSGSLTDDILEADTESPDEINEIYFADINQPGVIAATIVWGVWDGPRPFLQIVEMDQIYDDVTFDFAVNGDQTKMDLVGVATHEIGHGAGLGHAPETVLCEEQTMYPSTTNGSLKERTLEDGDKTGIQKLY